MMNEVYLWGRKDPNYKYVDESKDFLGAINFLVKRDCIDCGKCCMNFSKMGHFLNMKKGKYMLTTGDANPVFHIAIDLIDLEDFNNEMKNHFGDNRMCPLYTFDGCLIQGEKPNLCTWYYCNEIFNDAHDEVRKQRIKTI